MWALRGMFQASLSEYVSRASLQKDKNQESRRIPFAKVEDPRHT